MDQNANVGRKRSAGQDVLITAQDLDRMRKNLQAARRMRAMRERARKQTEKEDSNLGPSEPLYAPKLHPCGICHTLNPNYYRCGPCLRQLKSQSREPMDWFELYGVIV